MDNIDTIGILKQLERGEISAAEADERLDRPHIFERAEVERDYAPLHEETDLRRWARKLWVYPLLGGLAITAFGAWIIVSTVFANVLWLLLGLPILLLGTTIIALAASAESGPWLYVNVKSARQGRGVRIGMPFPIGLLRIGLWFAYRFGPGAFLNVRGRKFKLGDSWTDIDSLLTTLEHELKEQRGFTIDVDEKDERVQVYIV